MERGKQPEKRTSETPVTIDDFVEVSTRKKKRTKKKKKTGEENEENPRVPVSHARMKSLVVNSIGLSPRAGTTYAQIVKDLKKNVKLDEVDVTIHNVRKTAGGNVLLAFKCSTTSGKAFQEAVQKVVKEKGKVSLRTPKVTFEIRNLDERVTKDELVNALRTLVDGTCELVTHVIRPSPRVLVNTDPATATKLLNKARV